MPAREHTWLARLLAVIHQLPDGETGLTPSETDLLLDFLSEVGARLRREQEALRADTHALDESDETGGAR